MSERAMLRTGSPAWDRTAVDSRAGAFAHHLGLEILEVTPEMVTGRWFAGGHHHQPHGIVHGGVHCSVVETLGSVGAAAWLGERGRVVGVNNNTDFFRPVIDGELSSVARPLHRGRSQQVWLVETTDERMRVVARGQVRVQNLYHRT